MITDSGPMVVSLPVGLKSVPICSTEMRMKYRYATRRSTKFQKNLKRKLRYVYFAVRMKLPE